MTETRAGTAFSASSVSEMNRTLDTTEIPFGTVVRPLGFHRKTLKMEALGERAHALRVTALLATGAGAPFSVVVENYSRELVAP